MPSLTPVQFVAIWKNAALKERSAYQTHFNQLCELIGHPTPVELDEVVFAAYGWPPDLTDEQILERLLALNLERAAKQSA